MLPNARASLTSLHRQCTTAWTPRAARASVGSSWNWRRSEALRGPRHRATRAARLSQARLRGGRWLAQFHQKQEQQTQRVAERVTVAQAVTLERASKQAAHDYAYTQFAATRSRQRALVRFIRLHDYKLASALQTLLREASAAYIAQLHPARRGAPVVTATFVAYVSLREDGSSLSVDPVQDEFERAVGDCLDAVAEACCDIDRLLQSEALCRSVDQDTSTGVSMSMRDMIVTEHFEAQRAEASRVMAASYGAALSRLNAYDGARYGGTLG